MPRLPRRRGRDGAPGAGTGDAGADGASTAAQGTATPRRSVRSDRVIWIVAAVGVLSLLAGFGVSRLVVSPAQAAAEAEPPAAGLITVPVEDRVIANEVVVRGDALYEEAVQVKVETGDLGGPAVVTGRVPEVGTTLEAGSIALEIIGRPVIALPGDLPVYRTLRVGVAGPDVLQLKTALVALGIDPGDPSSDRYDAATARAVDALYARVGYPSPASAQDAADTVRAASDAVRTAEDGLAAAQTALETTQAGPSAPQRLALDNAVRSAERSLTAARAGSVDPETGATVVDPVQVGDAEDALNLALAERAAALVPPSTTAERGAVESARRQLADARADLAAAREESLTSLPASEVVYLSSLPRRVDDVQAVRGAVLEGVAFTVSGAELVVEASVGASDASLLSESMPAFLSPPEGGTIEATVRSVAARSADEAPGDSGGAAGGGGTGSSGSGRYVVTLSPSGLSSDQITALQGTNLRVRIPVESTGEEVLAVPLAALTAGPGGESRVEVVIGDPDAGSRSRAAGDDPDTELVSVVTGLAAGGYVQLVSSERPIAAGDLVVVGR